MTSGVPLLAGRGWPGGAASIGFTPLWRTRDGCINVLAMSNPSTQALRIRLAETGDTASLLALVNSVYRGDSSRFGWTTEADLLDGQRTDLTALNAFLNRPAENAVMLLAEFDGKVIACLQLEHHLECAHLGMLSVAADLQDRGIGRQMLAAAEDHARNVWRATLLTLSVIHLRHELIAWYQRRGFVVTGERDEFPYDDSRFGIPRRDDLWFITLQKSLVTS